MLQRYVSEDGLGTWLKDRELICPECDEEYSYSSYAEKIKEWNKDPYFQCPECGEKIEGNYFTGPDEIYWENGSISRDTGNGSIVEVSDLMAEELKRWEFEDNWATTVWNGSNWIMKAIEEFHEEELTLILNGILEDIEDGSDDPYRGLEYGWKMALDIYKGCEAVTAIISQSPVIQRGIATIVAPLDRECRK